MKCFDPGKAGRTIIVRLERGDLLRESIAELVKREGIENAVVVSGIATFDEAHLQMTTTYGYPIEYHVHHLSQPLELAGLDGTIINFEPHIHGVVSNPDMTWAGHLLDGCRILYLGEMVIQEICGSSLIRKADENGVLLISEK